MNVKAWPYTCIHFTLEDEKQKPVRIDISFFMQSTNGHVIKHCSKKKKKRDSHDALQNYPVW